MRKVPALLSSLALAIGLLVLGSVPGSAAPGTCPFGSDGLYHCYSEKVPSTQVYATGIRGLFTQASITQGDSAFIDSSMWMQTSSGHVMEVGICKGGPLCSVYSGYAALDGVTKFSWPLTGNGSAHTILLSVEGFYPNSPWAVYYDTVANDTSYCTSQCVFEGYLTDPAGAWYSCAYLYPTRNDCQGGMRFGGELGTTNGPDSTMGTGGFTINYVDYQTDTNGVALWHPFTTWGYIIDDPCGTYPAGACLNGTSYANDRWDWNKA